MWPFVVHTEGLVIPTYIALNSFVFSLGVVWIYFRAQRRTHLGYSVSSALDIALWGMIGGFIGARMAHVLLEHPRFYLENPNMIFKVWNGGFVFYGGIAGAFLAAWLVCRHQKLNFLKYADLFAPVLALGYSMGRLGCLAAGCCYGRPTDLPWAIHFPPGVEAPPFISLHPTQLYASLWESAVFALLINAEGRQIPRRGGELLGIWLTLHGLGRVLMERFRDDFRGPNILNMSISTWLSFAVMGLGLYLLATKKGRAHHASASH